MRLEVLQVEDDKRLYEIPGEPDKVYRWVGGEFPDQPPTPPGPNGRPWSRLENRWW